MVELNLPSRVEYLPLVDSLCQAFCLWTGMSRDITDDMAIAVVEAVTNAIIHGNRSDRSKKVNVSFRRLPAKIVVSVSDQGCGFNPAALPNPVEGTNLFKENGRGIYIMKHIMDEVAYDFPKGGGTKVRMSKCLTPERGRLLGIDYGEARLGLALSDELCIIARPLGVIETRGRDVFAEIGTTAKINQVGGIVVGLPLTLAGRSSAATLRVEAFVEDLRKRVALPVVTWDERLSTKQSEHFLIESGMRRRKRRQKVDAVAAALILQSYLDAQKEKCLKDT
jgi:putative Holliday junction resolvase